MLNALRRGLPIDHLETLVRKESLGGLREKKHFLDLSLARHTLQILDHAAAEACATGLLRHYHRAQERSVTEKLQSARRKDVSLPIAGHHEVRRRRLEVARGQTIGRQEAADAGRILSGGGPQQRGHGGLMPIGERSNSVRNRMR